MLVSRFPSVGLAGVVVVVEVVVVGSVKFSLCARRVEVVVARNITQLCSHLCGIFCTGATTKHSIVTSAR